MEAKEVEAEFKNSYKSAPQLITLPLVSFTETIASFHERVVVGCQIDCVIVNPEASEMKIVSSIVSTALAQGFMTTKLNVISTDLHPTSPITLIAYVPAIALSAVYQLKVFPLPFPFVINVPVAGTVFV